MLAPGSATCLALPADWPPASVSAATCTVDSDCSAKEFCDVDAGCSPKLKDMRLCERDGQCKSGACRWGGYLARASV